MGETWTVLTSCSHDCGGRCVLKAHVAGGRIVRIETDDGGEPQLRACLRGRAYRQRVYAPDRLKYPMKRVGPRGEGRFQRISWDEALDTVAAELGRVKNTHGNASILLLASGGNQSVLHGPASVGEVLTPFGGYTRTWGYPSFEGTSFASMATYGTLMTGSSRKELLNSGMIILWGWNPAESIWDTNTTLALMEAKETGIRIVSVDPRFTDSAVALAAEWVPIRPGTDPAMLIAMAHVIIRDGLHDQGFIDTYTLGFEKFQSYVMGWEDGVAKTPGWAEEITGVPGSAIERLAVEYATTKPAALMPGWAPARGVQGEQFARAANTVIAMTGNVGRSGGYAGGFMRAYQSRLVGMPRGERNPVERGAPPRPDSLHKLRGAGSATSARIHFTKVYDAILRGKAGGYPCHPRLAYVICMNPLCSMPDVNLGIEAFKNLEFIVVHEQRMTPTARFADILLPVNTFMEREDIVTPWLGSPYYLYMNRAIDSMDESKSDREICAELGARLGVDGPAGVHKDEELLRMVTAGTGDIPSFDEFREKAVVKIEEDPPFVAFKQQIDDPDNNPFPTLSGKIEIFCDHLAEMDNPRIPPIAKYLPSPESPDDPLVERYPLQLVTSHYKRATHSSLEGIPWLEELEPRMVSVSTQDAVERGILDGDRVLVFNDRGTVLMRARVTERIMPGVVDIAEGGWFDLGEDGVDRGGCANTLTSCEHSPGGAWATNTTLVEVRRA